MIGVLKQREACARAQLLNERLYERQQAFDLRLSGASAAGFKPIIGQ